MTTMTPPTGRVRSFAAPAHTPTAVCKDEDGDLFFPIGDNAAARVQAEQAKQICLRCPVREACLDWALKIREDEGVWGGTTAEERRALHGRRPRTAFRRNAAAHIMTHRLDEYRQLVQQGLPALEVAKALGTNVQTVNSVGKRLAALEWAEGVKAA